MQISPPKHLAGFIKHYIFLENSQEDTRNMRLFADGNTGLIISADMNMHDADGNCLPLSFFYGQPTSYKNIGAKGSFSVLAVIFQPYFFNLIFGIAAKEIKNEIISATDILKDRLVPFQDAMDRKLSPRYLISLLNTFFTRLISSKSNPELWIIQLQQYMLLNKGTSPMKMLEHFTGYSERHIERTFESHIGTSPHKYNSIIRLHHFLSLLKNKSDKENMAGLGYEAGYSDQSHLIKECKNIIGLTPSQYIKTKSKLAVNFIELG
ncbi:MULTISPECIES: AraC family transcriptional regulator [Chryseobacterium]|uniref:AraC-like DNA-binding protein n=1 Tax=Chryseobacterium camelliae TaxID=1265445 RepID=A0ABU0THE0_9FLAO|nr:MULTISPECIES: helix-turn-helix domain-containing protein [Chryseobacterium]MDT3405940.1 AraC-like DNA-binding protein [Pseudacidovorax intermedius]MDQ1096256.1 AraC-like DNA-binding protein [Chryseobacterium camelliae]MDQ1100193.1 AraC-like DNA-binding protein [Chryseobacterium sp. SORGH_AS_1048]MDR6087538.1 AraC-like DNA-binding protein [Chryseobacterium sp. SORGH_AS_0909]MDR6131912.1 AraC-like DNA-binding protein [Chryseobacterium sp. SORGH_AS_1175]